MTKSGLRVPCSAPGSCFKTMLVYLRVRDSSKYYVFVAVLSFRTDFGWLVGSFIKKQDTES